MGINKCRIKVIQKSNKMPQNPQGSKLPQTLCESKISEAKLGVLVTWWQKMFS
jgi:hypothetical protein